MLRTMNRERDRLLLRQEIARLQKQGYSFRGETEPEKLGVDAWVLAVGVVDDHRKSLAFHDDDWGCFSSLRKRRQRR